VDMKMPHDDDEIDNKQVNEMNCGLEHLVE
jgi:hypothetical protein